MVRVPRPASPGRAMALTLAIAALNPLHAISQENLLRDATFDEYRVDKPGPWEFRYGHKGGQYPSVRPLWKGASRTTESSAVNGPGPYLSIEKTGKAAGAVLVGQRITLPDPVPELDLGVHYRCFCAGDNRSGIVDLCVYTPQLWDSMVRDPSTCATAAPRGDVFQETVCDQGPDVKVWTLGRVSSAKLRGALSRYAGKQVVVAVSFLTWHETTEEWARFDNLWLGAPLPHIDTVHWPTYIYRGEAVTLAVDAASRQPGARLVLQIRPADSEQDWQGLPMAATAPGLYEATIPAAATDRPLQARATMAPTRGKTLMTETMTMQLTERPEHPNLFYSKSELARMREKVDEYDWAGRAFDGIKRNADAWLARAFEPQVISGAWWHHYGCEACGGRLKMEGPHEHVCRTCGKVWDTDILYGVYWSKVHGDHARAARDLALTYQMTGGETYARRAIEIILWYADHYAEFPQADKGGKVVSQTLDECVWLLEMMEAADLAYAAMTSEEATHVERDLVRAGAMYTRKYRGGIHNIRCWHNSCWASAGYFLGDPELVAFARGGQHGFVAQMEQGVLEDGMWYERSMGYHSYTVMAITYHLKAAMHAGDELVRMPQVRKLLTFPLMITFPNLVAPSLNDGGFSTGPIAPNRLELAAAWYEDPVAVSALKKRYAMGGSRASVEAWQFGEALPEGGEFVPPPSMDLKGAGLAVLRRGTGEDAACAMLEYGEHGGGHGHPDKLQLIVYALGRQLCPDLGTTGYANPLHPNYYKTTPAHNTVTIGGRNMAGRSGKLLGFEVHGRFSAAVARSDVVYEGYVLTRRVLLGDGFLVDEFVVDGKEPETLDWFLRADGELSLNVEAPPIEEKPLSRPYTYLRNLCGGQTADDWAGTWTFGDAAKPAGVARLVVTMKGEPGTQAARCDAPGGARLAQFWGTLRVRRRAAKTRFIAVHQAVPAGRSPASVSFQDRLVRVGSATVDLGQDDTAGPVLR